VSTETAKQPENPFEKLLETVGQSNHKALEEFGAKLGGTQIGEMQKFLKDLAEALARDPAKWQELQTRYYGDQAALWFNLLQRSAGIQNTESSLPAGAQAEPTDRRFNAPQWSSYPVFDYLRQSYLLTANWLKEGVSNLEVEPDRKQRLDFYIRQYIDAMSPSNFLATNPEALEKAIETKGESLKAGLKNMLEDLEKGRISMTDESAFEIGQNIALTPGSVVFQNDLIQIVHYKPTVATVAERPLLIVPPCINKFYIMDLEPANSMVKYCLDRGHNTFLVSWRNADASVQNLTWDDYVEMGIATAIRTTVEITGAKEIDALGYCVGGALLTTTLSAYATAKKPLPVASLTLMTTLLDYSDVGEIGVYINPKYVEEREKKLRDGGLVPGKELAMAFSSLRANDLIWPYVVGNYLKGETPAAFNLLYWNGDGTNLPGPMFAWYLRNLYLHNDLCKPNALSVGGKKVDLSKVTIPVYIFAAREDHIVPWKSAYETVHLLGGDKTFVLGASGHIAGSINPASKNKRNFWVGEQIQGPADEWQESSRSVDGSWWIHWADWLDRQDGDEKVAAPKKLGSKKYPPLEDAPGSYVKAKC
jgi:polyhydroxyalkanoate synthase